MDAPQIDLERLMVFEHARRDAESKYAKNPRDADNLTKWGGALIELSQFGDIRDSKKMIKEAISKLEEAIEIDPTKHETMWCLGNAHTSYAFLTPGEDESQIYFDNASQYFRKAVNEDPTNELYARSLEATAQAPGLHKELLKHGFGQQATGGGSFGSPKEKMSKNASSDLKYDICGWIILAVGIFAWVGVARSHAPPPPLG